ncbi:MAG TPA: hypothetical protein VL961_09900 [Acidimicrobiales bacterium]|nr:hypothetical protein [Acidimicrobiales bacterium]
MRTRIALTTAAAVTTITATFLSIFSSTPAGSARTTVSHRAGPARHVSLVDRIVAPLTSPSLATFATPVMVTTPDGPVVEVGGDALAEYAASTPPAPPVPPAPVTDSNSVYTADWMCIRIHESGNVYNDPNKPSGAYGILDSTWHAFGYAGWPYQAPAVVQDHLALVLHSLYGFRPWSSRFACGL